MQLEFKLCLFSLKYFFLSLLFTIFSSHVHYFIFIYFVDAFSFVAPVLSPLFPSELRIYRTTPAICSYLLPFSILSFSSQYFPVCLSFLTVLLFIIFFFFQTGVRQDGLFRLHFMKFISNINNSSPEYQSVAQ
jgi:hypothetical protein